MNEPSVVAQSLFYTGLRLLSARLGPRFDYESSIQTVIPCYRSRLRESRDVATAAGSINPQRSTHERSTLSQSAGFGQWTFRKKKDVTPFCLPSIHWLIVGITTASRLLLRVTSLNPSTFLSSCRTTRRYFPGRTSTKVNSPDSVSG